MKNKRFKKLIQKPLRFHHQDIHEELDQIKGMLRHVVSQMQSLQHRIDQLQQESMLRVSEYDDRDRGQSFGTQPQ